MNTSYVRLLLEDAAGNLRALLGEMASNAEFSEVDLSIHLNEVYGSLNTAWNGRQLSETEAPKRSEEQYYRLRQFPTRDIIMDGT
jgi:hypothetical protein